MSFRTLQPSAPSSSPPPSSDSAVQVAVRIRPLNPRESALHAQPLCRRHPGSANTVLLEPPINRTNRRSLSPLYADNGSTEAQTFGYDFVYDDNEQQVGGSSADYQQRLFDDIGLQILDNALSGYNVSLLAYGQTSSGKTYSMMGQSDADSATAGLIPRVCSALFEHINTAPSTSPSGDKLLRKVECSYLEIYSEKIRDLLDPTHRNLRIRENPKTGPYVDGLSVCAVSSYDELAALMSAGNAERTIASTNMNAESSRSHAVFTVIYTQTTMDETTKLSSDVVSKVQLVDLAGSERVEQSGASGVRLREASQINKSLTTLGRVVQALAERSEKSVGGGATGLAHRHSVSIGGTMAAPMRRPRASVLSKNDDVFIPFRDSVLTWLLKESLGGNSRTIMLACVSPADSNWEETVSTLRYASRAKSIVNTARINEDPNAQLIRTLKAEIDTLRSQLAQSTTATSPPPPAQSPSSSTGLTFTYAATSQSPNSTLREKDDELLQMNAHIARLQAELTASSVSMLEREAAWEARLQEARELEARRMKDMEGRGVSVRRNERELPFMVNLNEDPALSESLIYYVADGTTTVGSRKRRRRKAQAEQEDEKAEQVESGTVNDSGVSEERKEAEESDDEDGAQDKERRIVLSGIHVKEDHCTLTKHAHGVIMAPIPFVQAETHINGELLTEERMLMHGDRVVIGGQHYFRFSRSKAAIEADRAREEERRRKKKEDLKARISIDTNNNHLATPLSATPSASPIPDDSTYDFEFAQRELIVGGGGSGGGDGAARAAAAALNTSRGGAGVVGNRSMNRSAYEDNEPDSSPDPPQRPSRAVSASASNSSLPTTRTTDGATISIEQLHTPSKSPTSPPSASSAADSSSPSTAAKVNVSEEKEKEDDAAELQVPKFHLGRDVKGSIDWSSRRALTKGEIDEWIRHDRRYLAKHQQRLIDKQHAACVALMQPLQHYSALEYKLASHAAYRWRWHVIKAALREDIMRLVFLCDEANAICSALGRPERYKVELASSHNVLPEVFLSLHPRSQLSQPQCSPLQRLRQLKVVFCQVVEVRRRMLPLPVLSFDLLTFQEQLAVLREHYNDMLEGQDDIRNNTLTPSASSTVSLSSLSSPISAVSSLLPLPSTQLYSHPHLLGRTFCFLHALRYGHSVKHNAVVLDERGEQAGVLTLEIELASVDEDVARKEIAAEEKLRGKEDRDDESNRTLNQSHAEVDEEDAQSTEIDPVSPSTQSDDEQKNVNTFMSAHRVLALIVRILSYDTQTRQLRRCGLQSVWVKYHVKDSTVAYRSKKLSVRDDTSRYMVDMERSHYFSGMDLQGLTDWLEFDCVVFELWCMVDDSSRASQTTLTSPLSDPLQSQNGNRPRSSLSPSASPLGSDDGSLQNEDDEASVSADHDRRESLAKRMQSPLNRSASRDTTPQKRDTEKSLHSRAPSHLTPAHHRRSTFGSSSILAHIKPVEEERVQIENGQKVADHLLFCAVDVEEEVAGGGSGGGAGGKAGGGYAGCSLKEEGADGQMIFRVGLHRDHRLVISLLQVDQRPFVLESVSSATVTALTLSTGSSRYSPPLSAPITFPIVEQFAHVDHKLLVCTTGWPRALTDHTFFSHASAAGERISLSLRLECFFSRTTAPVLVTVETQLKVYKSGSLDKPSLFGKKAGVSESERLARIGLHFSVTRQSSPQTVGNVVREHELVLEQLQRRLRFEHRRQHQQLINKLRSTQPHLLSEVDQRHIHGADGLTRHFTLRFSRILADLRRRGGIQVAVERVSPDSGVKCGYLNLGSNGAERRKPAAPFEPKWAVLRPPYLFLYNRRGEKKEHCIVRLMKADYVKGDAPVLSPSGASGAAAGGSAKFVWSIKTTAGVVYTLQAANEGEMKSWLRALGANLAAMGLSD